MTQTVTTIPVVRPLDSPFLTIAEAARYSRHGKSSLWAAIREYRLSHGSRGLKPYQQRPHTTVHVHVEDLVRWMDGQPPIKGGRRFTP